MGRPLPGGPAGRTGPAPGRRAPARLRWALAAFLILPLVELLVAIEVGRTVGALPTLLALIVIAVAGSMLVRRSGAAAWRELNASLQEGRPPSRELADKIVLVVAGVLLIAPGFVTDVVALLLLFPPTRPLLRRPLERAFARAAADRVTLIQAFPGGGFGSPSVGRPPAGGGGGVPPRFGGDVVEGEIIQDDESQPPR